MSKVTDLLSTIAERLGNVLQPGKQAPQSTQAMTAPASSPVGGGILDTLMKKMQALGGDSKRYGGGEGDKLAEAQKNLDRANLKFQSAQKGLSTAGEDLDTARSSGDAKAIQQAQQGHRQAQQRMLAARKGLVAARKPIPSLQKAAQLGQGPAGMLQGAGKLMGDLGIGGGKVGTAVNLAATGARAAAGDPTAMVELAGMSIKDAQRRMALQGEAVGEVGKAFKSERLGETGSHLFGAGEKMGKSLQPFGLPIGPTGAMGFAIEKVSAFGKFLSESVDKLRDFNKGLLDSSYKFSEFSAAMTGVQARHEVKEMQLSQERGDRRAGSTEKLMEAQMDLENAIAPIEDMVANFKNEIMAFITPVATKIIEGMSKALKFLGLLDKKDESGTIIGLREAMERLAADEMERYEREGRPERFR